MVKWTVDLSVLSDRKQILKKLRFLKSLKFHRLVPSKSWYQTMKFHTFRIPFPQNSTTEFARKKKNRKFLSKTPRKFAFDLIKLRFDTKFSPTQQPIYFGTTAFSELCWSRKENFDKKVPKT